MSDSYTNQLLQRHLDREKPTLKALLEPYIRNDTADDIQRDIYSRLVLHCLQRLPTPRPTRACNKPFKTLFALPKANKYDIKLEHSTPEQPQTNNMHFTLTNFNGYKSDANKGFTQPRFEKHESQHAVSIVKECTNVHGATLYDGKSLWVSFYNMSKDFRTEFQKSARTLKAEGNKTAAAKMVSLINQQSAHTIAKTTAWQVSDAIEIVKHMNKRLFNVSKDELAKAVETYKVSHLKEPLIQALSRYSGNPNKPQGIRSWKNLLRDANKQKVQIPTGMLKYLHDASAYYPTVSLKDKEITSWTATNWSNPSVSAEAIQDVYDSGKGYSMESGEAGVSLEKKAKLLWHALCGIAYQENIKVTNGIIEKLQEAESMFKTFKKAKTTPAKRGDYTLVKDKAAEEEIKAWTMKKLSDTWVSKYQRRTKTDFESMLKFRTDVRYMKPIKDWKGGYTPEQTADEDVQEWFYQPDTYAPLIYLWNKKQHMGTKPIDTWKDFGKFMLQDLEACDWTRYLLCGYVVAHRKAPFSTNCYKNPTLVGDTLEPIVQLLVEQRKCLSGMVRAKYLSALLPLLTAYWFKARRPLCYSTMIISRKDYEARRQLLAELPYIEDGLFIVVHEHGLKLYKREHKTSNRKVFDDFELLNDNQIGSYPYLAELLPEIVDAYAVLTGHHVTPHNTEPRWYISSYSPKNHNKGWYRCLQYSAFPMLKPSYENGCKNFISPKVIMEQSGAVLYAKANPESLIPVKFQKKNKFEFNEWEYFKDKTIELRKYDTEHNSLSEIDCKRLTVEIQPMKHANKVREESYGAFWKKNMSYDDVNQTIAVLDSIFKTLVKTGKFVLEASIFGEDICVSYKGEITEHLQLAAAYGSLDYNFLGRYCSTNVMTDVLDEIKGKCSLTAEQNLKIGNLEKIFLAAENHVSATIARNAYHVFQNTLDNPSISGFSGFYRVAKTQKKQVLTDKDFSAYDISRLSSHPYTRPSWSTRPTTFVTPVDASGEIEDRCSDARQLSILEQNAQIFYFRSFWGKYEQLIELNQTDRDGCYTNEIATMESTMKDAQRQWDKKWGGSLCEKVTAYLSPGKRPRDDTTPQRLTKRIRTEVPA